MSEIRSAFRIATIIFIVGLVFPFAAFLFDFEDDAVYGWLCSLLVYTNIAFLVVIVLGGAS